MTEQNAPPDRLSRLIEAERLRREGPTLKNVAENMRTIAVMIAMFVASGVLFQAQIFGAKALAILWGGWTLVYAFLAAFQAGMLLALALFRLPGLGGFARRPSIMGKVVANVLAGFAVLFMVAAASILTSSISSVPYIK